MKERQIDVPRLVAAHVDVQGHRSNGRGHDRLESYWRVGDAVIVLAVVVVVAAVALIRIEREDD